jgi:hypothetical protein
VPGLFPEGLTFLVGAPKLGKSFLALNVGLAVAHGGMAIGKIGVSSGDVLYLALEDTERRLQERLRSMLGTDDAPERLHLATAWPSLADGAADHLGKWLDDHPDARLVIIDTFQKLRGPIAGNQNIYAADYHAAGELKQVADRHGVAVVLVHHTRKADADDPLDTVSGSAGLAGSSDGVCVLRREIGKADAVLYIRGRDVPEADHALTFDPETCSWTLLGDAAEFRMSEERREIVDLLRDAPEPMSPKAISEALDKKPGAVRKLLHGMAKDGEVVGVGGAYTAPLIPGNTGNTSHEKPVVSGFSVLPAPEMPGNTSVTPGNAVPSDSPEGVTAPKMTGNTSAFRNPRNGGLLEKGVTGVTGVTGGMDPDPDAGGWEDF